MSKLPSKGESFSLNSNCNSSPSLPLQNQPHVTPAFTRVHISNNKFHQLDHYTHLQLTLQKEQEQSKRVKNLLLEKILRLEQREKMAQDEARKLNSLLKQLVTSTSVDEEQVSQLKHEVAEKQKEIDVLQDEVENQRKLRFQVSKKKDI